MSRWISNPVGDTHARGLAELTIRGTTQPVALDVAYLERTGAIEHCR